MVIEVTGGTGFIGSHLCNELADRDHDVVAVSRNPEEGTVPVRAEIARAGGDVTDPTTLDFSDADTVVHLVALSPLKKPRGKTHHEVTAEGTANVIQACERDGVERLVHVSALGADPDGLTAYIRAKGKSEDEVCDSSLDWTIFRPSVVFGNGGEFVSFTETLTTPYVTGLPGGGKNSFQPIYVEDLVSMISDSIGENENECIGETYEVGGPEVLTLAEMAKMVYRKEDKPLRVLPVPMPLAKVGLTLAEAFPFVPFGSDQYRSLKMENVVKGTNEIDEFGVSEEKLITFGEFLGTE